MRIFMIVSSSYLYNLGQGNWIEGTDWECKGINSGGGLANSYRIFVGKSERKRSFVRWTHRRDRLAEAACHNVDRFKCLVVESNGGLLWAQHEPSCSIDLWHGLVTCSLMWGVAVPAGEMQNVATHCTYRLYVLVHCFRHTRRSSSRFSLLFVWGRY
jgi:hypothetical protein